MDPTDNHLVPAKFTFDGDQLDIVPRNGTAFAVFRRICEAIGVDFAGQLAKAKSDPAICMEIISMQMPGDDQRRDVACIDIHSIPLWLANIHPSKVKPEVRDKLIRYKRECAKVLADHFIGRRGVDPHSREYRETIATLRREKDVMAARLEVYEDKASPGVIGRARANSCILQLIAEAARIECAAEGDYSTAAFKSALKRLDNRVRHVVHFPASSGQKWEMLPIEKLADAYGMAVEIRATAEGMRRRMARLRKSEQRDLFDPPPP